jgi:hypothetical protein
MFVAFAGAESFQSKKAGPGTNRTPLIMNECYGELRYFLVTFSTGIWYNTRSRLEEFFGFHLTIGYRSHQIDAGRYAREVKSDFFTSNLSSFH